MPTAAVAQRIVRPRWVDLHERAELAPGRLLTLRKHGDDEAWLTVAAARFEVRALPATGGGETVAGPVLATLVTDTNGGAGPVELPPGRYRVIEIEPPVGYDAAGPWDVDLTSGDATLSVEDRVRRGAIEITKVDSSTHEHIAGARFSLAFDAAGNGTFSAALPTVSIGDAPLLVADLLPGDHRLVEVEAPPGYALDPRPRIVRVEPGVTTRVVAEDGPLSTVTFRKAPTGTRNADLQRLAGAVFVVHRAPGGTLDLTGPDVGRCLTDRLGACSLPPGALDGGARYCWEEQTAPTGFGPAPPACFVAGTAGTTLFIEVPEPSALVPVGGSKTEVGTGAPLAGAVYDLWRRDPPGGAPIPEPPAPTRPHEVENRDDGTWVGAATSDAAGKIEFPPQLSGFAYCAIERTAPPGFGLDPTPRCTPIVPADGTGGSIVLGLVDQRTRTIAGPTTTTAPAITSTTMARPAAAPKGSLPRTGLTATRPLVACGGALVAGGLTLVGLARRRTGRRVRT